MGRWDHYRNEPIDANNIKSYVSDLSAQAQAAELRGDKVTADYIHQGIDRELDDLRDGNQPVTAAVEITSFGYLHNPAPTAHITLDLRDHFRDPHIAPTLRHLTAEDETVQKTVMNTPGIQPLIDATEIAVLAYLAGPGTTTGPVRVAIGCAGGRHRAATVATALATCLRNDEHTVTLHHRDIDQPVITR